MALNKSELVAAIAERTGEKKATAARFIDALAGLVEQELASGTDVTLPGIGKLEVVRKNERPGRNPRTGETTTIPAQNSVKFKTTSTLKAAIQ